MKDKVAIVGIGNRFPGGIFDLNSFGEIMENKQCVIRELPNDRWSQSQFYDSSKEATGKTYTKWGGFIDNIYDFDYSFYGFSKVEVEDMDPQQRLILKVAHEAFENANIKPSEYANKNVGIFIGAMAMDHMVNSLSIHNLDSLTPYSVTGSLMTLLSNRISYQYDFTGPSITIDTACSSSLTSIHLACKSILNGECSLALAGGVSLMLNPSYTVAESKAGMLSPTGQSRTWDDDANGYVRADGAGIVVLKKLSDAIRDKDYIYAVVAGSAINQDGKSATQTMPSSISQKQLIIDACNDAGISPRELQYVEAHGTGTPVGDPIEMTSLIDVLSNNDDSEHECYVGSVKTVFGHAEAASGIAGLIKIIAGMQYNKIYPHLGIEKLSSKINLPSGIKIPFENIDWSEKRKIASVNSFGFGGSNAHVVLQSYDNNYDDIEIQDNEYVFLPISAKSEGALHKIVKKYLKRVESCASVQELHQLCAAAMNFRDHFQHRVCFYGTDQSMIVSAMISYLNNEQSSHYTVSEIKNTNSRSSVAMVFSGMGPQWWGMGRELYKKNHTFRSWVIKCHKAFVQHTNSFDLLHEFECSEEDSHMNDVAISQNANFALQVALAQTLKRYGIKPSLVVGHSLGEIAAAFTAGALSFDNAILIVYQRSRLLSKCQSKGGMLAVGCSIEELKEIIGNKIDDISIAANNSKTALTLSGKTEVIESIAMDLDMKDIFNRILKVDVPFHSSLLDDLKEESLQVFAHIKPMNNHIRFYSTVLGREADGTELNAEYWWKNLRQTVEFNRALEEIIVENTDLCYLEIGPHPVLQSYMNEELSLHEFNGSMLYSLNRKESDIDRVMNIIASQYTSNTSHSLEKYYPIASKTTKLPLYQWDETHLLKKNSLILTENFDTYNHQLLGKGLRTEAFPTWETFISLGRIPDFSGHIVEETNLFPGAAFIEMALSAVQEHYGLKENIYLKKCDLFNAVIMSHEGTYLKTVVNTDQLIVEIYQRSSTDDQWSICFKSNFENKFTTKKVPFNETMIPASKISNEAFYANLANRGFAYQDKFQKLDNIHADRGNVYAEVYNSGEDEYLIEPFTLDMAFQTVFAGIDTVGIPKSIDSFMYTKSLGFERVRIYTTIHDSAPDEIRADIVAINENDEVCFAVNGLVAQVMESHYEHDSLNTQAMYVVEYEEIEQLVKEVSKRYLILSFDKEIGLKFQDTLFNSGAFAKNIDVTNLLYSDGSGSIDTLIFNELMEEFAHYDELILVLPKKNATNTLPDNSNQVINNGFFILNFFQLVRNANFNFSVSVITNGCSSLFGEGVDLNTAGIPGLARVLSRNEAVEYFNVFCDMDSFDSENILQLTYAINNVDYNELYIRNGKTYVPKITYMSKQDNILRTSFDSEKTYIVTGGLGALGQDYVRFLAAHHVKHILVITRSESSIHNKENISFMKSIQEVANIRAIAVDIQNKDELKATMEKVLSGMPPVGGVLFSAGILKDNPIDEMNEEDFRSVASVKITGMMNLMATVPVNDLDLVVSFSSVSSIFGLFGQSNYAYANSWLDAFASYLKNIGIHAISINWGPFKDKGMASDRGLKDYFESLGIYSLDIEESFSYFEKALNIGMSQSIICPINWSKVEGLFKTSVPNMFSHLLEDNSNNSFEIQSSLEELKKMQDPKSREIVLLQIFKHIFSDLNIANPDQIFLETKMSALGIDSLSATMLNMSFKKHLEIEMPGIKIISAKTIKNLIRIIEDEFFSNHQEDDLSYEINFWTDSDDEYHAISQKMVSIFNDTFSSKVKSISPERIVSMNGKDGFLAAFGLTNHNTSRLFSEQYMQTSILEAISEKEQCVVSSEEIVEINSFVANSIDGYELFLHVPQIVKQQNKKYLVMTAIEHISKLLHANNVNYHYLGDADESLLEEKYQVDWGNYYLNNPKVIYMNVEDFNVKGV